MVLKINSAATANQVNINPNSAPISGVAYSLGAALPSYAFEISQKLANNFNPNGTDNRANRFASKAPALKAKAEETNKTFDEDYLNRIKDKLDDEYVPPDLRSIRNILQNLAKHENQVPAELAKEFNEIKQAAVAKANQLISEFSNQSLQGKYKQFTQYVLCLDILQIYPQAVLGQEGQNNINFENLASGLIESTKALDEKIERVNPRILGYAHSCLLPFFSQLDRQDPKIQEAFKNVIQANFPEPDQPTATRFDAWFKGLFDYFDPNQSY